MPAIRYALRANERPALDLKSISRSLGNTGDASACDGAVEGTADCTLVGIPVGSIGTLVEGDGVALVVCNAVGGRVEGDVEVSWDAGTEVGVLVRADCDISLDAGNAEVGVDEGLVVAASSTVGTVVSVRIVDGDGDLVSPDMSSAFS